MLSDLEVMDWHLAALYRHDATGRLLTVNEPDGQPAPRLVIGRTRQGNRWRVRHDVPAATAAALDYLLAAEPVPSDLREPPRALDRLRAILAVDAPVTRDWFGPAWWCPADLPAPSGITPFLVTAAALPAPTFPWLAEELDARQPCLAVRHGGEVVALCFSSRLTDVAAEAGVETLAPFRGRGYAAAAVAAWAAAVRRSGRLPLYSTSWENVASQGVVRKLGLIPYGADLSLA